MVIKKYRKKIHGVAHFETNGPSRMGLIVKKYIKRYYIFIYN
jgi:hypothetical protein